MKLKAIVDEIAARVAIITVENSYSTDIGKNIVRGKSKIQTVPGCAIYLGGRSAEETKNHRAKVDANIIIEAVIEYSTDPENKAFDLLADIQNAVETTDDTLSGKLTGALDWSSDEIQYPESDDQLVAVQVTYSIPHIRHYGDADS